MKKLLIAALCVLCGSAFGQGFSVSGKIEGLQKGDTLSFSRITYPGYETQEAFFVLVDAHGAFRYQGRQDHATSYSARYKPVKGSAPELDRMGLSVFVGQGDRLKIVGERQFWAVARIKGGVYSHPIYGRIRAIEDSLGRLRCHYMQQLTVAREQKDVQASKKYSELFNNAPTHNRASDSLWSAYIADPTAGENAAIRILSRVTSTPLDVLSQNYAALSDRVKNSHHGQLLTAEYHTIRALVPGSPAPDFTLANDQGTVGLADFKGKYLLIYHWGACPGSIQIDPQVQAWWAGVDRDKVAVIAATEGRTDVETMHANISPGTTFSGLDLKECLSGMLAHPFPDYDLNRGDNAQLAKRFAFGGLPYFVLIDPEGNLVARGYHEVFFQAQKLLPRKKE